VATVTPAARVRVAALGGVAVLLLAACAGGTTTGSGVAAPSTGHSSPGGHTTASPASTPTPAPLRDGERFLTLGLDGPYRPSAPSGSTDDYRCFLLDPALTASTFLTGVTFLPGNPEVVHHAILFRVPAAQVVDAQRQDADGAGQGWSCFGGTGIRSVGTGALEELDTAPWLAAWAPGGREQVFGEGAGVQMDADSRIVLQVHYNLLAGDGPDSTTVRLRLAKPGAALLPLTTMLLPAPVELPCPAGVTGRLCNRGNAILDVMTRFGESAGRTVAGLQLLCGGNPIAPKSGVTQTCDRPITQPATIRAAAGHMHLLGRSIRIEVNPGRADARTLLDIQTWDFDDQAARPLADPVSVGVGDTVRVTCTHDAGLRDQLPALSELPPRYVVWGEGTSDEMCLGILIGSRP